jgi:membrane protein YqaA with SNARE-associated domain
VAGLLAVAFLVLSAHVGWFAVHGTIAQLLSQNWWSLAVVCMLAPAFKLATIGSGLVGVSIPSFLAAAGIARLARFGVASALARFGGPPVRGWLLRHAHAHPPQQSAGRALET